MPEKSIPSADQKSQSYVTYGQLTVVAISAFIGAVSVLLFQKLVGGGATHIDTLGLIGFTLSVLLSGASIVLAVSAIMLGKFSEDALIRRSDESIRLQNDVFLKTTDALQRIESSTGVTEKRLEDIVAGRVGALSQSIAEIATAQPRGKRPRDLEEQIRNSILKELRPEIGVSAEMRQAALEERRRQVEDERKLYQKLLEELRITVANQEGVELKHLGEGKIQGEGLDLFDVAAKKGDKIFGFCLFRVTSAEQIIDGDFITRLANRLASGLVNRVVVFLDITSEANRDINPLIETLKTTLRDDVFNAIEFTTVDTENLHAKVVAALNQR